MPDIILCGIANSSLNRNVTIKGGVVMRNLSKDARRATQDIDICFQEDSVSLLMNSCEQILTEKIKSFLRFGTRSTRYKDIFDIFYLSERVNVEKLKQCIQRFIYEDDTLPVKSSADIGKRMTAVLTNERFIHILT